MRVGQGCVEMEAVFFFIIFFFTINLEELKKKGNANLVLWINLYVPTETSYGPRVIDALGKSTKLYFMQLNIYNIFESIE